MRSRLTLAWQRRGLLAVFLWPISLLYASLAAVRRTFYRWGWLKTWKAPVPVLVVGNVVAGGVGKTPVVLALLDHLKTRGWQPGVVSRGYGRATNDCREVLPDSAASEVGDEPLLIARRTRRPVFVATHRADAVRAMLSVHPQVNLIVCDDGLQHLALARDVEICVFDERGAGNGWLLPAGPLREPWPRQNDRALVLNTGLARLPGFQAQRQLASYAVRADGNRIPLAELKHQTLMALAAIGHPERFFDMLRQQGLVLEQTHALPDHADFHSFFDSFLSSIDKGYTVICTEKDAVKLWPQFPQALAVPLDFSLPGDFLAAVDRSLETPPLSSRHGHQTT